MYFKNNFFKNVKMQAISLNSIKREHVTEQATRNEISIKEEPIEIDTNNELSSVYQQSISEPNGKPIKDEEMTVSNSTLLNHIYKLKIENKKANQIIIDLKIQIENERKHNKTKLRRQNFRKQTKTLKKENSITTIPNSTSKLLIKNADMPLISNQPVKQTDQELVNFFEYLNFKILTIILIINLD